MHRSVALTFSIFSPQLLLVLINGRCGSKCISSLYHFELQVRTHKLKTEIWHVRGKGCSLAFSLMCYFSIWKICFLWVYAEEAFSYKNSTCTLYPRNGLTSHFAVCESYDWETEFNISSMMISFSQQLWMIYRPILTRIALSFTVVGYSSAVINGDMAACAVCHCHKWQGCWRACCWSWLPLRGKANQWRRGAGTECSGEQESFWAGRASGWEA